MRDVGNTSFLHAAERHYDALYGPREPICSHCEASPVRDSSEGVYAKYTLRGYPCEGDICFECASAIFEEELIEFGEGLQCLALSQQFQPIAFAAE